MANSTNAEVLARLAETQNHYLQKLQQLENELSSSQSRIMELQGMVKVMKARNEQIKQEYSGVYQVKKNTQEGSFLLLYPWTPVNSEAKLQYDRDFLLQLQFNKLSMKKPALFPLIPELIPDKPVPETYMAKRKDERTWSPESIIKSKKPVPETYMAKRKDERTWSPGSIIKSKKRVPETYMATRKDERTLSPGSIIKSKKKPRKRKRRKRGLGSNGEGKTTEESGNLDESPVSSASPRCSVTCVPLCNFPVYNWRQTLNPLVVRPEPVPETYMAKRKDERTLSPGSIIKSKKPVPGTYMATRKDERTLSPGSIIKSKKKPRKRKRRKSGLGSNGEGKTTEESGNLDESPVSSASPRCSATSVPLSDFPVYNWRQTLNPSVMWSTLYHNPTRFTGGFGTGGIQMGGVQGISVGRSATEYRNMYGSPVACASPRWSGTSVPLSRFPVYNSGQTLYPSVVWPTLYFHPTRFTGGFGSGGSAVQGNLIQMGGVRGSSDGLLATEYSSLRFSEGLGCGGSALQDDLPGCSLNSRNTTPQSDWELERHRAYAHARSLISQTTSFWGAENINLEASSHEKSPAQLKKELFEEEIKQKTLSIIDEFMQTQDLEKAVLELNYRQTTNYFVSDAMNHVLERSKESRQQTGHLFHYLIDQKVISVDTYIEGLTKILQAAEKMETDMPNIWRYLKELIDPVIQDDCVPLSDLKTACDSLKTSLKASNLIAEIIHDVSQKPGHIIVEHLRQNKSLEWTFIVPQETIQQSLKEKNPNTTVSPASSHNMTSSELDTGWIKKKLKELQFGENNNEKMIKWIETNIPGEITKGKRFTRALMTSVCSNAIVVDKEEILKWKTLLLKYLDHRPAFELQALNAVKALVHSRGYQSGVLHTFLDIFHNDEIISKEAFKPY